ncbi:MAG: glycosyltransferase [Flavobacteriales bacterium]|nr:glycosyltransferase [Flavobacteriales bacterium]
MAVGIKIVAVIVVYQQFLKDTETYRTLLEGANIPYMVYDNSPNAQALVEKNISYIHNSNNPGVSKAYNEAIKWAKGISASHLLLLDSDSNFPKIALETYTTAAVNFPNQLILPSLTSAGRKISPFYFFNGKSHYGDSIKEGNLQLGRQLAINAGSLLPLAHLENVNFNEKLPLDWSDVYFFRELSKTSIKAQHIPLTIEHSLSEHEERTLSSVKFRFGLYLKGISEVSDSKGEKLMMYFWAKLKATKLGIHYTSPWFLIQFVKRLYG